MATSVLPKPTSPHTTPVHGHRRLHVLQHLPDGAFLVGRLLEGKGGGETGVFARAARAGMALRAARRA